VVKLLSAGALLSAILIAGLLSSAPALAGPLNVPGDFPGSFRMDLLVINAFADHPGGTGEGSLTLNSDELGIDFTATEFSGTGDPDWGTSTLATTAGSFEVGRTKLLNKDLVFFIAAGGPGTLVDLGNGTGHWTLTLPLRVEYPGEPDVETDATLTTNGSYSYYDDSDNLQSVNGAAMDYATGNAFLVGQVLLTEGSFAGYRVTVAINGNDPVVVPEPTTLVLMSLGLIGLARLGRRG
jgi:hypothetical protein